MEVVRIDLDGMGAPIFRCPVCGKLLYSELVADEKVVGTCEHVLAHYCGPLDDFLDVNDGVVEKRLLGENSEDEDNIYSLMRGENIELLQQRVPEAELLVVLDYYVQTCVGRVESSCLLMQWPQLQDGEGSTPLHATAQ